MPAYKLTAPRQLGEVPKGFVLQVASRRSPTPDSTDVERALRAAGFTDNNTLSYKASGNWKVEKQ
jgi:hypothetical protein